MTISNDSLGIMNNEIVNVSNNLANMSIEQQNGVVVPALVSCEKMDVDT